MFAKATRKQSKLRLNLAGPSGCGKTMSALLLAKGIGGKIAVVDTEHGSASLYSDVVDFDVVELSPPYSPERYIECIEGAERAGYDVLIIDSMTHEWAGAGGILQSLDAVAKSRFKGNSYMAWSVMTPRHNAFIDKILQSSLHIIATTRSKQDFVLVEERGKQIPKKVGMAPIQRDGIEYEFTCVLDLTIDDHFASASKDRTRLFSGDPLVINESTGKMLVNWLNDGESMEEVRAKDIATHLKAIKEAGTMDELRGIFKAATTYSTSINDAEAESAFTAAKDKRKGDLS